ncbi:MAG: redoxin domain-containing protein [Planctomycetes bacterium]|nr:redoxin domain-containing protein [Planctomycetota bacterium]
MQRSHFLFASMLAALLGTAVLADSGGRAPRAELKSIYSTTHKVAEFRQAGTKAVALVFVTDTCPVAQRYLPRLRELHEAYHDRGVQFLAIYCGTGVDVWKMAQHAHDQDVPFPVLLDVEQRLAGELGAERTPEAFLLNNKLEKVYQGAIDNQFSVRGQLANPTRQYLRDAIERVLAGQAVDSEQVPASGCPIEKGRPAGSRDKITYYRDIAPILQARCQACHRQGGLGPFELKTYADAYDNSEKIREVVVDHRMPPWHGVLNPKFGELLNDKRLTDEELRKLVGWIDSGGPEGNRADSPAPLRLPDAKTWSIGQPDYVYQMPQPFRVPKNGVLDYQFFRVKLNLPQDRWIQAVQIRPGNAEVVHHVALHLVKAGNERFEGLAGMLKLYGFSADQAKLINDYVPGDAYNAKTYPPTEAVRLPRGTDLVFEVHYTPNNRAATTDQSQAAFRWAGSPPLDEVLTQVFRKPIGGFRIPPHEHHYTMEDSYYFKDDVLIDAIRPHFHLRGKSFRLEIVRRDDDSDEIVERETVLAVPVWDANWQRTYELKTPLKLLAGTELLATGHWDNSKLNPNNPDPSATVEWGQQSTDEMFSTRFKYRLVSEGREPTSGGPTSASRQYPPPVVPTAEPGGLRPPLANAATAPRQPGDQNRAP